MVQLTLPKNSRMTTWQDLAKARRCHNIRKFRFIAGTRMTAKTRGGYLFGGYGQLWSDDSGRADQDQERD